MSTLTICLKRWGRFASLAAFGVALSACQSGQPPEFQRSGQQWQVVESIGEARIERNDLLYAKGLRSGDRIADDSRIMTGQHTQLIMSRNDLQFTANGKTTVILPKNGSSEALSHRYGELSVRLASAADDEKRIVTPHLMTSGTSAAFDLQVDDQGTSISMKSGHAAISTSDGRHYVTLTAGASARLGRETNGTLEIQPAKGLPFRPNPKLEAMRANDDSHPAMTTIQEETKIRNASRRQRRDPLGAVVLPAKVIVEREETCRKSQPCKPYAANMHTSSSQNEASHHPKNHSHIGTDTKSALVPASSTELSISGSKTTTLRPDLDQQFDHLTDGLLDDLPSEPRHHEAYP